VYALCSVCRRAGETAADAAAALAARQAIDIQGCVADLYASPEIVKQVRSLMGSRQRIPKVLRSGQVCCTDKAVRLEAIISLTWFNSFATSI